MRGAHFLRVTCATLGSPPSLCLSSYNTQSLHPDSPSPFPLSSSMWTHCFYASRGHVPSAALNLSLSELNAQENELQAAALGHGVLVYLSPLTQSLAACECVEMTMWRRRDTTPPGVPCPRLGSQLPHPSPLHLALHSGWLLTGPCVLEIPRLAWCLVLLLLLWAQGLWGQRTIPALDGASSAPRSVSKSPTVLTLQLSVEKHKLSGISATTTRSALLQTKRD